MGIPAQVQRQLDAADALQASLLNPAPAPAAAAPEDTAPAPAPVAPPEPAASAPAAPAPSPASNDENTDTWAQRYRSLQGMFSGMQYQLRQSTQQVQDLTARLAEATARLESTAAPKTPEPAAQLVTGKDADAFGPELIDLARRVAREEFEPQRAQLLGQVTELTAKLAQYERTVGNVAETQSQLAQRAFYASLESVLPFWNTIQATPECQAWLISRAPASRDTWNDRLIAASQDGDASRAIEVFEEFLRLHPAMDPRKAPPAPTPTANRPDVQRQVAPSKPGASSTEPAAKGTMNSRQYEAEMMRATRLRQARKYQEADALETELNAALQEGRVTP
jgi:hypothetical protein